MALTTRYSPQYPAAAALNCSSEGGEKYCREVGLQAAVPLFLSLLLAARQAAKAELPTYKNFTFYQLTAGIVHLKIGLNCRKERPSSSNSRATLNSLTNQRLGLGPDASS